MSGATVYISTDWRARGRYLNVRAPLKRMKEKKTRALAIKRGIIDSQPVHGLNMLFRLFTMDRQLFFSILGVIGRNGKVYFSSVDIALLIGQHNIDRWAKGISNCKLSEILPDCNQALKNVWVIEQTALFHFLAYRMFSGYRADKEKTLYELLEYGHVRLCGQVANVVHLETCSAPNGKLLIEYLKEFRAKKIKEVETV